MHAWERCIVHKHVHMYKNQVKNVYMYTVYNISFTGKGFIFKIPSKMTAGVAIGLLYITRGKKVFPPDSGSISISIGIGWQGHATIQ